MPLPAWTMPFSSVPVFGTIVPIATDEPAPSDAPVRGSTATRGQPGAGAARASRHVELRRLARRPLVGEEVRRLLLHVVLRSVMREPHAEVERQPCCSPSSCPECRNPCCDRRSPLRYSAFCCSNLREDAERGVRDIRSRNRAGCCCRSQKLTRPSNGSAPCVTVPRFCSFMLSCDWYPTLNVCEPHSFVRPIATSCVFCMQRNGGYALFGGAFADAAAPHVARRHLHAAVDVVRRVHRPQHFFLIRALRHDAVVRIEQREIAESDRVAVGDRAHRHVAELIALRQAVGAFEHCARIDRVGHRRRRHEDRGELEHLIVESGNRSRVGLHRRILARRISRSAAAFATPDSRRARRAGTYCGRRSAPPSRGCNSTPARWARDRSSECSRPGRRADSAESGPATPPSWKQPRVSAAMHGRFVDASRIRLKRAPVVVGGLREVPCRSSSVGTRKRFTAPPLVRGANCSE